MDTKPTVSWIVLTYNRAETVRKAISHCIENAGYPYSELIHVDNGSSDHVRDVMADFKPTVSVFNNINRGVAIGYNTGLVLSRSDYIVITGCDMLMPSNWLKLMVDYITRIPQTGVACIYSGPLSWVPERARKIKKGQQWNRETINGLDVVHAMPIGRRILSRKLLKEIGYFHEGFGLYGYDDIAWGETAIRVCDEKNLLYYVIPDQIATHLGTEGVNEWDKNDPKEYHEFKQREVAMDYKQKLLRDLHQQRWPRFDPYE